MFRICFGVLSILMAASAMGADIAPNAPDDKPVAAKAEEIKKIEAAIKPYVEQARKSYPDAKKRFLAGLPAKHVFFVVTILKDKKGATEQVFIAVTEIKDGTIKGQIQSDIGVVTGYKNGDAYSFPESELVDWLISRPDGTEEGNVVGKFLDGFQVKK